jgi:serine/threonine protein kinase
MSCPEPLSRLLVEVVEYSKTIDSEPLCIHLKAGRAANIQYSKTMAHIFQQFEVGPRYEPLRLIGKGSYGLVCAAKDRKEEGFVAIKKIAQIFENVSDSRRLLREIKLLTYLYHENVVSILDIVQPSNPASFEDLYVVSELMDTDLHRIIRSEQLLLDDHCQYIM